MKMHYISRLCRRLIVTLSMMLLVFMLSGSSILSVVSEIPSEYERYVHDLVDVPPYGNWTFVEKPVFPIYFNHSQIPVGFNWTVVCPLAANHTYHIYCFGEWINYGPASSTDYDIYVYNPIGELEGYHTESVGLPEHLGSTVDEPFFTPKHSGNYSFVINNDPRESHASLPATLMIIENAKCNIWHEVFIEGKEDNIHVLNTSRAFEFVAESQQIEVWVRVPEALDMYEVRLYLMASPEAGVGEMLNTIPLAWEQGLYGELDAQDFGGYNLESKGFRGLTYASCEFHGQDMLINYTSPTSGKSLYHLVFIGEEGAGKLRFAVKTRFEVKSLTLLEPIGKVYPGDVTTLAFAAENCDLKEAKLHYTTNNWQNSSELPMMETENGTCTAAVPGQEAGTLVQYRAEAVDALGDEIVATGNYTVKYGTLLEFALNKETVFVGETIAVSGFLTPSAENLAVHIYFKSSKRTIQETAYTQTGGNWTATFATDETGNWTVQAKFDGNNLMYEAVTQLENFTVEEVKTLINTPPYGNWTYIKKPMFPIEIKESQIPIGANWTILCHLVENHRYHIYFYGDWVNTEHDIETDYDIYVYNPLGELEGYHTQSAELPEHLGIIIANINETFFTPKYTGNYTFIVRNDPRESQGAQAATFMIIENAKCNTWHEAYIQGKENNMHRENTSWAFEFATHSSSFEVWVRVPEALDMYEVRLYLMASPEAGVGEVLDGVPLAWELGLYGELDPQSFGGYNLESKGFSGVASASCEFYGQDMLINYTSPFEGDTLYHLVLVGEEGNGDIEFLIKTEFGYACLKPVNPPFRVYPDSETTLTFDSNSTNLRNAVLYYSVDGWKNVTALKVNLIDNRTCDVVIPGQSAGATVQYRVEAADVLENVLIYNGSYPVKYASQLNLTLQTEMISIGESISLRGFITPSAQNLTITLIYNSANGTIQQTVFTIVNGTFTSSFKPSLEGIWSVQAMFEGNDMFYNSSSVHLRFLVEPPSLLSQYSIYIYAGVGMGMVSIVIFYVRKRRE